MARRVVNFQRCAIYDPLEGSQIKHQGYQVKGVGRCNLTSLTSSAQKRNTEHVAQMDGLHGKTSKHGDQCPCSTRKKQLKLTAGTGVIMSPCCKSVAAAL